MSHSFVAAGDGFLAAGEGAGLGVVVLAPAADEAGALCRRLAEEGFTAYAPASPAGAIDYLVAHPAVRGQGVGVVGLGAAGGAALALAADRPDRVDAVVLVDGVVSAAPDWDRVEAAVEGHYADADVAAAIEGELTARGRDVRMFTYPGGFDEDGQRQSWVRTLEFLRAKLG